MPDRMNVAETKESGAMVARARAGDAEAWGDLYREYAPAIFRFCRRALPTREDAEDATMEIFMKIRDKLDQYDATRPFSAWLYKVARDPAGFPNGNFGRTAYRKVCSRLFDVNSSGRLGSL